MRGLDRIALDIKFSDAQKDAAIIAEVKRQLGIRPGETPIIDEFSDEVFKYDPDREHQWRVDKLITRPTAQGPDARAYLNRPLGMLVDIQSIPFASQVLEVCFETHDDKLCVCRAIAALRLLEAKGGLDSYSLVEEAAMSFDMLLGHDN